MKRVKEVFGTVGSFAEQYADKRWAARAKQFRGKYDRFCQSCRRGDVAIQVHHVNYRRGVALWDHSDEDMAMLCESCHHSIHNTIRVFRCVAARCNANNIAAMTGIMHQLIQRDGEAKTVVAMAKILQTIPR
jgi:hypothetical protein